jgi:hypothetical protein
MSKEIPNSTELIELCEQSLQGYKDELKRNGLPNDVDESNFNVGFMNGFYEGRHSLSDRTEQLQSKLAEREEDRWLPIAQYPKDNPVVERWHKIYKCTVSVKHRRAYSDQCEWITGTLDNTWPEEAFAPFFKSLPTPPKD